MHEFSVQSSLKEALDDNVIDCALGPLYINVNSSANGGSSSMSLEVVTLKSSRHQMSHRRSALQEKDAEKGCVCVCADQVLVNVSWTGKVESTWILCKRNRAKDQKHRTTRSTEILKQTTVSTGTHQIFG
ncbi:GL10264 [Drosophila persimilis]|uniref:GL10264 n=1 Tax=Drosophila persimilis TaxID=7234 RepID=B4HDA1_DROPE|nr:GL10264 [Drosophila persimilis]